MDVTLSGTDSAVISGQLRNAPFPMPVRASNRTSPETFPHPAAAYGATVSAVSASLSVPLNPCGQKTNSLPLSLYRQPLMEE